MKPSANQGVVLLPIVFRQKAHCGVPILAIEAHRSGRRKDDTMVDDFDEDDEDVWAVHNSLGWYLGIFITGVIVAALVANFI
jgi:hypothetical protein